MDYWTNLRVRTINFFKRNRKKIIVLLILWLIVIFIEYYLRNHQNIVVNPPITTYTPYVPVMDNGQQEVPKEYQEPIESLIDQYFNYCNNGQYEQAYNLITEDCRKKNYPTLEEFKAYIDEVFEGKKKIYNIQSYSIVDNKYIFNIRILDDILANGTTDGYYYYEEKFVLIEENGEIKLSIAEYIGDEEQQIIVEDDNLKIEVVNKSIDYETETYTLQITNKTDKYIVLSDNYEANEISLYVNGMERNPKNLQVAFVSIPPNAKRTQNLQFTKYYDETAKDEKITFNNVRIFEQYDWAVGTTQENLDNAIDIYSFEIPLEGE